MMSCEEQGRHAVPATEFVDVQENKAEFVSKRLYSYVICCTAFLYFQKQERMV
jgi:hypothetical protein